MVVTNENKMSSLVADYGSESDSNASEDANEEQFIVQTETNIPADRRNYLITNEDNESSDSDENSSKQSSTVNAATEKLPNPLLDEKLPKPDITAGNCVASGSQGSVFANRYESAEMAKRSILEKHVKMTEGQFLTGKKAKICRKFKQGRCFYGNNCQYSHDIDSNLSLLYKKGEAVQPDGSTESCPPVHHLMHHSNPHAPRLPPPPRGFMGTIGTLNTTPGPRYTHKQHHQIRQQQTYMQNTNEEDDDDKFTVGDKRKRRVGVSQTLIPPKKAMATLTRQREEERPWTIKK